MTPADDDPPEKDQSMDDILASIRRIMLDEQARLQDGPATLAFGATKSPAAKPDPVVILDSSMVVREMPAERRAAFFSDDEDAEVAADPVGVSAEPVELPETPPAEELAPVPPAREPAPKAETIVLGASEHGPVDLDQAARPVVISPQAIEALMAPAAAAAAAASVEALLKQLTEERLTVVRAAPPQSPTIEEIVRAELRPYLKAWLDEHLPPMVERLVRVEITRLIGRSGF